MILDRVIETDCGYLTPCLLWQGAKTNSGYGKTWRNGKTSLAHRVSYIQNCSEIPEGFDVDHLCGIKTCVNPAHLEAVESIENRRRSSKLNKEVVQVVRAMKAEGLLDREIAAIIGVTRPAITKINCGITWSDVPA